MKFKIYHSRDQSGAMYARPELVSQHRSLRAALRKLGRNSQRTLVADTGDEKYTLCERSRTQAVFMNALGDTIYVSL